jgi:uncharacterized protein YndB with AHSA1/START domain
MHAERTVVVGRPIDIVFEFLAAGPRCTRWREGIREIARMTNTTGLGSVYRQVMIGPAGHDIDCDYLVTGYDPPRRLEFEIVAGPVRPRGHFELIARDEQHTEVRFFLDAEIHGVRRVLAPVWERVMRREVEQLDQLKTVLEDTHTSV